MEKNRITKAIIDQREEITSLSSRVKIVERSCFKKYKTYIDSSQIKVIMGVRRCGKSVLAYSLLKDKPFAYVNFDDEKLGSLVADDLNDVLEVLYAVYGNFKYILLDEIQNILGWELFVNRLQRQGFNVLVTGSNANLLSRELSTHLTGRHITLELFPFSFNEYVTYRDILTKSIDLLSTKESVFLKKELEEYMVVGGFPDVVKDSANRNKYLQSLYSDILHKDIIFRHNIKLSSALKEIANSFLSNTASYVSFNKVKNMFNLKSVHTARSYISFFEESFLFFLVPRFSYKAKERDVASRKVYCIDVGMIDAVGVAFSKNKGKICENVVFLELLKKRFMENVEIYYWQDASQHEVDFVIKKGKEIVELIQVCYDISNYDTKKREINALMKSSIELKCRNLLVITDDYEAEESVGGKKIVFIPLWKWLLSQ